MKEMRNILLIVEKIKGELKSEGIENKAIDFNLEQITKRVNVALENEIRDCEKKMRVLNDIMGRSE